MKKIITLFAFILTSSAFAQTAYSPMSWGLNKGATPYAFGANINGTWRDMGTVSPAGLWTLATSAVAASQSSSVITSRMNIMTAQQGATTSATVYSSHVPPGWFTQDVQTSTLTLSPGSNLTHGAASADYVRNVLPWKDDASCPGYVSGIGCNAGVGYFSAVEAGVDGAKTWALNPTLVDNTSNTQVTTDTLGRSLIGEEFNFSIYANKTTVAGIDLIIQGPSAPLGSTAIGVTAATGVGNVANWTYGFVTRDAAATNAMSIGATATSGSDIPSQPIFLNGYDSGASGYAFKLQTINHSLNLTDNTRSDGVSVIAANSNPGLGVTGSSANANLNLYAKGSGRVIVNSSSTFTGAAVFNSSITTGVEGSTAGSVAFKNATSGTITLQPTTGALGTVTATLPANTGTIAETNLAQTFSATQTFSSGISVANLAVSATAPTISSGFGTSPSVTANNGTAAFRINVGTGGTATDGVVGLPTAANGWNCFASDITTPATGHTIKQSAGTTTSVTLTNYNNAGTATAWAASDIIIVNCMAY